MFFRFLILVFFGFLVIAVLVFYRTVEVESPPRELRFMVEEQRPAITFLLGQDKEGQHFFQLAEQHFLLDSAEKTDRVVKSCRSLHSILDYLQSTPDQKPWGVINLVAHGNMWGGLSVPIREEGERAFPKELFRAAMDGQFPVLPASSVDEKTRINIWACGIGKNPLINLALEMLFTNEDGVAADIYASPYFVIFREVEGREAPVRLNLSYWPYFFRSGYRPSETEISRQLAMQYPDAAVPWKEALQSENPDPDQVVFHNEFKVPVVWTVLYPDKNSRPDIGTDEQKMDWINNQSPLMQKIEDLEIPLEKYHWTVNKILFRHPDGRIQPAIKAIGLCTVLCVLGPSTGSGCPSTGSR
jgi:hypothetical protein